jgi:hypothetical protein
MRTKRRDEMRDFVKATGCDRYRNPRLCFQEAARSVEQRYDGRRRIKQFEYLPVPSNPVLEDFTISDKATRGIVKVELMCEFAKFSWLEIFCTQVCFLLNLKFFRMRSGWGCGAAGTNGEVKWKARWRGLLCRGHLCGQGMGGRWFGPLTASIRPKSLLDVKPVSKKS